jgi:hypothetical protein
MREVKCHNCGLTSRHLLPILEQIVQLQSVSSEDELYINYACPFCNKLTRSLVQHEKMFDFAEAELLRFPDDMTEYAVSLGCAKVGCESPVILLAPVKLDITHLAQHIGNCWEPHGAACAKGHSPAQPFEVLVASELK